MGEPAPASAARVTVFKGSMPRLLRSTTSLAALCASAALALLAAAPASAAPSDTRSVLFVGNNWAGTADVIIPRGNYRNVERINIIPDYDERMLEIYTDPVRLGYFLGIRELVGEGNDQFVDDMYTSNDGRLLIVSRPSFRDVVAIRLATGQIKWRFVVAGQRSDHMAVSPDGRQVAVSASTGNVVHLLNVKTGEQEGVFPSGDSPHENVYSENGDRIYHASIGLVYTPADNPTVDTTKGERYFQIMDPKSGEVIERINMGEKLAEAGYEQMSAAVRPMAIAPRENNVFFQVSFFHGYVVYNFKRDEVSRIVRLPNLVPETPREDYLLDSAHHGIAMNGAGNRLCVAGTMSDYAAIVSRKTGRYKLLKKGTKPYWSTTSDNGRYCYVSWSGTDSISVIDYEKRREIANIPVGDHPQRVRTGTVRSDWLQAARSD